MPTLINRRISKHCCQPPHRAPMPRVLCVDDDPDIQTAIELRMRDYHVEIEHAFYGMQGIVEAVKTPPDLMLMDLAMPNGNGEYLLTCIKNNRATADVPTIVLTGMRSPLLRSRLHDLGADAFLQKPVHFDELLHEMGRFIRICKRKDCGE